MDLVPPFFLASLVFPETPCLVPERIKSFEMATVTANHYKRLTAVDFCDMWAASTTKPHHPMPAIMQARAVKAQQKSKLTLGVRALVCACLNSANHRSIKSEGLGNSVSGGKDQVSYNTEPIACYIGKPN
eukprot:826476-Amphidinium_carterae.1